VCCRYGDGESCKVSSMVNTNNRDVAQPIESADRYKGAYLKLCLKNCEMIERDAASRMEVDG